MQINRMSTAMMHTVCRVVVELLLLLHRMSHAGWRRRLHGMLEVMMLILLLLLLLLQLLSLVLVGEVRLQVGFHVRPGQCHVRHRFARMSLVAGRRCLLVDTTGRYRRTARASTNRP